jgi:hypothetical protein
VYPVVARVHSACSPLRGSTTATFDDRCATTTDVLVVAYQLDPGTIEYPYAYAYYPAMPVAKFTRSRSPKPDHRDHRNRRMAITETGHRDRWSDQSVMTA